MQKRLLLAALGLCACQSAATITGNDQWSQPRQVRFAFEAQAQLTMVTLNALQAQSFQTKSEFCGYIVRNTTGRMLATPATQGNFESCLPAAPAHNNEVLASYHTHGAFEPDTPAEFPSINDVQGDQAEDINGYLSTPGGRIWFVNGTNAIVTQLCGVGCVTQDPAFIAGLDGTIPVSLTLQDLRNLEMQ